MFFRLANFVVLALGLLLVGAIVLWVRSYRRVDTIPAFVTWNGTSWDLVSSAGELTLQDSQKIIDSYAYDSKLEQFRQEADQALAVVNQLEREYVTRWGPVPSDLFERDNEHRQERAKLFRAKFDYFATVELMRDQSPPRSPYAIHQVRCLYLIAGIAGLMLAWPVSVALCRGWRHRWRLARGLCKACGYDLHGTPRRCPECGSAALGEV